MAKSIIDLTRGIPTTTKGWLDVFAKLNKFLRVSGDELQIGGDIALPAQSVGTAEMEDLSVTDEKFRESQGTSVIGRSVSSPGAPSDIQASGDSQFLRRAGGVLGFGAIVDGDIPSSIARDTEVASAVTAHEAAPDPHPQYALDTALAAHVAASDPHPVYPERIGAELITGVWTISGAWVFTAPFQLPSYTVATVPTASTYPRSLIWVSDESGGSVPAFSDGTNWRRVTDRNIVS